MTTNLFQVGHITGKERGDAMPESKALGEARRLARLSGHRYVLLVPDTNDIYAVTWPDGGVDFQPKPYPTLIEGME